ncbi:MAG: DegV family protein [Chloroflexi bacterium]|nr:DegV family protein [Chloroflexota bacterium]
MSVKIVTDSTSDLPEEIVKELGVTVVPLSVFFGEEAYKDGIEITREEFFKRLTSGNDVHPHTSQPSVEDFVAVYKELTDQGHEVVSVHVSDKMSGTMNSARLAQAEMPDAKITLVDTGLAALALGLVVKFTAEAAAAGKSFEEVVAVARETSEKTHCYFMPATLEFLQKGGRIGKASAIFGGLLSIKPILTIQDGDVRPFTKVRTEAKAVARLLEIATAEGPFAEVGVIHEGEGPSVTLLMNHLKALSDGPVVSGQIGSVVGVHTGPGVIGMALRKA